MKKKTRKIQVLLKRAEDTEIAVQQQQEID